MMARATRKLKGKAYAAAPRLSTFKMSLSARVWARRRCNGESGSRI